MAGIILFLTWKEIKMIEYIIDTGIWWRVPMFLYGTFLIGYGAFYLYKLIRM